jgi:hypothetical protein
VVLGTMKKSVIKDTVSPIDVWMGRKWTPEHCNLLYLVTLFMCILKLVEFEFMQCLYMVCPNIDKYEYLKYYISYLNQNYC